MFASEENRVYARTDAPVTRVTFNVGDVIECQEGWSLSVEQVIEDKGILTYMGTREDTKKRMWLYDEIFFKQPNPF